MSEREHEMEASEALMWLIYFAVAVLVVWVIVTVVKKL